MRQKWQTLNVSRPSNMRICCVSLHCKTDTFGFDFTLSSCDGIVCLSWGGNEKKGVRGDIKTSVSRGHGLVTRAGCGSLWQPRCCLSGLGGGQTQVQRFRAEAFPLTHDVTDLTALWQYSICRERRSSLKRLSTAAPLCPSPGLLPSLPREEEGLVPCSTAHIL